MRWNNISWFGLIISKHRCETLADKLSWSGHESSDLNDRWADFNRIVSAINEHRQANMYPAHSICIEDRMSRSYGLGVIGRTLDCPTTCTWKWNLKQNDLKSASCESSGITLRSELTQSATDTSRKSFEPTEAHGTAKSLRLLEPWFHSNQHACGNPFYAFVAITEAHFQHGFLFSGVVKKVTYDYRMKCLSNMEMTGGGEHVTMLSYSSGNSPKLMATVWSAGKGGISYIQKKRTTLMSL